MDPNIALAELRKYAIGSKAQWALLFEGLDNWLMRGGFLPEDWQKAQDADKAALREAIGRPAYEAAVCSCTGINAAPSIDCPVHSPER